MACSDTINELVTKATSPPFDPLTYYEFMLIRHFDQPFRGSDSVKGVMLPISIPPRGIPALAAAHMQWAYSDYLTRFTTLMVMNGGVFFTYSSVTTGTLDTGFSSPQCSGPWDSLIISGTEKPQNAGAQSWLPSTELLWVKKV